MVTVGWLLVINHLLMVTVDGYFSTKARLGWRPRRDLELSLCAQTWWRPPPLEFVQETILFPEQVECGIFG